MLYAGDSHNSLPGVLCDEEASGFLSRHPEDLLLALGLEKGLQLWPDQTSKHVPSSVGPGNHLDHD
jgi:hypothetical protein